MSGRGLRVRHRTESEREMRKHLAIIDDGQPVDTRDRPLFRAECKGGPRPCPFVGCEKNNYLNVNANGTLTFNFPHLEPWEMDPRYSCSEDVADRGGATLDEVGAAINLTRERIRQTEMRSIQKIQVHTVSGELELPKHGAHPLARAQEL